MSRHDCQDAGPCYQCFVELETECDRLRVELAEARALFHEWMTPHERNRELGRRTHEFIIRAAAGEEGKE